MTSTHVTLRDLAETKGLVGGPFGSSLVNADYVPDGVPVIRGSNLTGGPWIGGDFAFVSRAKFERDLSRNAAQPGDVVFTQRGTLGQVALVPPEPHEIYVISQSQMRLRVDRGLAEPKYVYYACNAEPFRKQISDRAIATGVPHINLGILGDLSIPLPSVESQRAILEVLGALDDKIASNGRLTRAIDELLSSHFARLGVDEEPEGIGASITHYVHVNPAVPMPRGAEAIYLDMKSVPEAGPAVVAWSRRPPRGGARFRNGDTVMARITPCLENGKTGYVDFMDEGEVGVGSTEFIVLRSRDHVPMPLSYFLARSPRFREFAVRHMVGSSGRQRLSGSDLQGLQVQVVPQGDLDAFGALAGPLMSRIKAATDESRALVSVRDSILPLLMAGKVRVKDAEKAVEEVV